MASNVWSGEEPMPPAEAQIVVAPFEHRDWHGLIEQSGDGRQVPVGELLLEVDGVGCDDGSLTRSRCPECERRQVGKGFPNPGSGLHHQAPLALERLTDRQRHLDLRLAVLVGFALRERPVRPEQRGRLLADAQARPCRNGPARGRSRRDRTGDGLTLDGSLCFHLGAADDVTEKRVEWPWRL